MTVLEVSDVNDNANAATTEAEIPVKSTGLADQVQNENSNEIEA